MLHKTTRRAVSALLTLALILSLIPAPPTSASGGQGETRDWIYIDALADISLTGQAALDMLGDMSELLLSIESGDSYMPDGQMMYYAPPSSAMDMSDYDVLNFAGRIGDFTVDDASGVVTVDSAYEAAAYMMYRIMSGTGYTVTYTQPGVDWGGWKGVYSMVFTPSADMPYSGSQAGAIARQIADFVYAYFPHYFIIGTLPLSKTKDGGKYLDTVTVVLAHTVGGDEKHWEDERAEVEKLYSDLKVDDDEEESLWNVYKYLAENVVYNLKAPCNQEAYSALVNKSSVCNGYALATSMLCFRMGLDVPYMNGYAGGAHAWNLNLTGYEKSSPSSIRLVDTTWGRGSDAKVNDEHFNKPLDDYRDKRIWSKYYESYIAYVHGIDDYNFHQGMMFNSDPGITYGGVKDLTVPGSVEGFSINLSPEKETFTATVTSTFTSIKAYSVDGGVKWKPYKADTFSDAKFTKLLNKELKLRLSDKDIDRNTKQPEDGAQIVTFADINKRPAPKLVINYELKADDSGDTAGHWVLADKPPRGQKAKAFTEDIHIGLPDSTNKKLDGNNWGTYTSIPVMEMSGTKPEKRVYLYRHAPKEEDGVYTPASKMKKVTATSRQKAPNYKVSKGKINIKANTWVQRDGGTAKLYTDKAILSDPGTYTLWMAATDKKPSSEVKQPLLVILP